MPAVEASKRPAEVQCGDGWPAQAARVMKVCRRSALAHRTQCASNRRRTWARDQRNRPYRRGRRGLCTGIQRTAGNAHDIILWHLTLVRAAKGVLMPPSMRVFGARCIACGTDGCDGGEHFFGVLRTLAAGYARGWPTSESAWRGRRFDGAAPPLQVGHQHRATSPGSVFA